MKASEYQKPRFVIIREKLNESLVKISYQSLETVAAAE